MTLAEQLRAVGVLSFPCWVRYDESKQRWTKGPAVPRGVSWLDVALEPDQYPSLPWSAPVIGLPIPNGIVVLDLDTYRGSSREQAETALGGPLPWDAALIQRTISGGEHYAFRCSWNVRQGNDIGIRGLDTRSPGRGFICTGEGYTPAGFGAFAFSQLGTLPELPDHCRAALELVEAAPTPPPAVEYSADTAQVITALSHINPGCPRSEWLDIGFALKGLYAERDDEGSDLFERWSAGEFWHAGTPDNYEPGGKGAPGHQWLTFKADGKVRPATLFYRAIQGGWRAPAGIDTAAAFGPGQAPADVFGALVEAIRETGGDVKRVPGLIDDIQAARCSALQVALLAAELKTALRETGVKSGEVEKLIDRLLTASPAKAHPGQVPAPGHCLDENTPLHPSAWAPMHTTGKDLKPRGTLKNFEIMAGAYGLTIEFDEVRKEVDIKGPCIQNGGVLYEEAALAALDSIANLNGYPTAEVRKMIMPVANQNTRNPVREYVLGVPWDGQDHVGALWREITLAPEEDARFCETLFRKWLRGAYAIGAGIIDRWEFVVVLVDPNGGAGKTRFFSTLCPPTLATDSVILDTADRDSVKLAVSYWLSELGELDATFSRSESNRLKAFLSRKVDEMRLPYARAYVKYPRRTAFWASVNETNFLIDQSDNRRFWGIRILSANHQHGVTLQQVWAQAAAEVAAGVPAHLTPQEHQILVARNEAFRTHSPIMDALSSLNLSESHDQHQTVSEILAAAGLGRPNKTELNEAARWLRRHGFVEVKRGGRTGFRVQIDPRTAAAFQPKVVSDER